MGHLLRTTPAEGEDEESLWRAHLAAMNLLLFVAVHHPGLLTRFM